MNKKQAMKKIETAETHYNNEHARLVKLIEEMQAEREKQAAAVNASINGDNVEAYSAAKRTLATAEDGLQLYQEKLERLEKNDAIPKEEAEKIAQVLCKAMRDEDKARREKEKVLLLQIRALLEAYMDSTSKHNKAIAFLESKCSVPYLAYRHEAKQVKILDPIDNLLYKNKHHSET